VGFNYPVHGLGYCYFDNSLLFQEEANGQLTKSTGKEERIVADGQ
jgi:hypothetical protein